MGAKTSKNNLSRRVEKNNTLDRISAGSSSQPYMGPGSSKGIANKLSGRVEKNNTLESPIDKISTGSSSHSYMGTKSSKGIVNNLSGRVEKNNTLESPVDRISDLPDSILGIILSSLPTKNAVATSTLSKRWKFVWRTIHNLDFYRYGSYKVKHLEGGDRKFVEFVNHVLLHLDDGVLNKFRLVWKPKISESQVTSWIKFAIGRNVRQLSLVLDQYRNRFNIPISVFSCNSLQYLELDGYICLSAATVPCLSGLEILHLKNVTFESAKTFETIIKGCPVLKHLYMHTCQYNPRFIISSTSLRRLDLNFVVDGYLELEASSLEYLKLYGYKSVNLVPKNLTSLVEVEFGMDLNDDDYSQARICDSVVDTVSALSTAKVITLSKTVMPALSCATIKLSREFTRLVKLEINTLCCYWSSLQDFIQGSPDLKVLTVHQDLRDLYDENDHDHSNWTTPVEVPICLSTSLKNVTLNGYNDSKDERDMIRYMLEHGSALEVMEIRFQRNKSHKNFEAQLLQQIHEFPRKSPACRIIGR